VDYSKTQLTAASFSQIHQRNKVHANFSSRIKRNGAQRVHDENEQPNDGRLDHCSIASSISSWLIMSQQLFMTCFRWSTSSIFWCYTSCCRAPKYRVVHRIQIRWVMRPVGWLKSGTFIWSLVVKRAVLIVCMQVTTLMTCGYFGSINKEYIYISIWQISFIKQLTAIFAVYFNANVTILGQIVRN